MKIKTWHEGMSDKETADLAYWERNCLALYFADGWYNDDVVVACDADQDYKVPRFKGWRRVLTLRSGRITFHIPDDFDVGSLAEVPPKWDGHSTEQKWRYVLSTCGVGDDKIELHSDVSQGGIRA